MTTEMQKLHSKTKGELIEMITKLQKEIRGLKESVPTTKAKDSNTKSSSNPRPPVKTTSKKKKKKHKSLDWSKVPQRKVALQFTYLGHDFCGNAFQTDNENTVEQHLIDALVKVKLVNPQCFVGLSKHSPSLQTSSQDRSASRSQFTTTTTPHTTYIDSTDWKKQFSRSGRTDKGVSAMRNCVVFKMRYSPDINYMRILNRILPQEIRIIGWTLVDPSFDARFCCLARVYKYFFIKNKKNVHRMQEAAKYLLGEHDFRNFCKLNVIETVKYTRTVLYCNIQKAECGFNLQVPHEALADDGDSEVWEIEICGRSFLWHMVRSIASILFLVGDGKEEPTIVKDLLNLEKYPARPQYLIASEYPLLFYDCFYEDMQWNREMFENDASNGCKTMSQLEQGVRQQLETQMIRTAMLSTMYHMGVQKVMIPNYTKQEIEAGKLLKSETADNEEKRMTDEEMQQTQEPSRTSGMQSSHADQYQTRLTIWNQIKREEHIPVSSEIQHKSLSEMPRANSVQEELEKAEKKKRRKQQEKQ